MTPQWKRSVTSTSMQIGETWSLKCTIVRLDRQNRKFPPVLIITEAKNDHFFVCKRTGFVHQELRYFEKMTLTRVTDFDSSRLILWKTWLESRTIFLNVTRVESESTKIVTRVESLTRVTLSLILGIHFTDRCHVLFTRVIECLLCSAWASCTLQRWVDCENFQSESSPDPIKLNPIQSWSAIFFKITSPIQSWSAKVKSCVFVLPHGAKECSSHASATATCKQSRPKQREGKDQASDT